MTFAARIPLLGFLLSAFLGCTPDPIFDCEDKSNIHPICGFHNPEDIAIVEGGQHLVVTQMGSFMNRDTPGSLALFDLKTEKMRVAYPGSKSSPKSIWGDASCPGEMGAAINPHGIDLAKQTDGSWRLLVVNHANRESIEFFELVGTGKDLQLEWRGCSVAPEELFLNDVVNLPDGGFLATHMLSGWFYWGILRAGLGLDTGGVYEWQPNKAWRLVPGTEAPFPNGLEISANGEDIYLNVGATDEVRRISRATGKRLATGHVVAPDNSAWGKDGRLLVASHTAPHLDKGACLELEKGACPFEFEIQALDPKTLQGDVIFSNVGAPMGGATVAVDLGNELVLGSSFGDRIIRVKR
ncbi:MAG: hypothetical protein HRU17_08725 [Polyangiaceae bacterium]|nr:hypothetical protein [Polyangiaceae bacterium]